MKKEDLRPIEIQSSNYFERLAYFHCWHPQSGLPIIERLGGTVETLTENYSIRFLDREEEKLPELKACPSCLKKESHIVESTAGAPTYYSARCINCEYGADYWNNKKDAVAAWNNMTA